MPSKTKADQIAERLVQHTMEEVELSGHCLDGAKDFIANVLDLNEEQVNKLLSKCGYGGKYRLTIDFEVSGLNTPTEPYLSSVHEILRNYCYVGTDSSTTIDVKLDEL